MRMAIGGYSVWTAAAALNSERKGTTIMGDVIAAVRFCYLVRRFGPRCGAPPPWRLADDAGTCVGYRGHDRDPRKDGPDWHADGRGYIWNDVIGRWQWMGPVIDVEESEGWSWET